MVNYFCQRCSALPDGNTFYTFTVCSFLTKFKVPPPLSFFTLQNKLDVNLEWIEQKTRPGDFMTLFLVFNLRY